MKYILQWQAIEHLTSFYNDMENKEKEWNNSEICQYERMALRNERFNLCTESIHCSVAFVQSLQLELMKVMVASKNI